MSSNDNLYKIEVLPDGVLRLYEWDDGQWDPESLDSNETLEAISEGRYLLKETYPTFIEVKEFAPTPDTQDGPELFVIVDKYYTNSAGDVISSSEVEEDDDEEGEDKNEDESKDESKDEDLYKIEVLVGGGLALYEMDDGGIPELEDLDNNKTLEAIPGTDRYQLKELYADFIKVKELAPVPDPGALANSNIVIAEYYTDLLGNRISSPGAEGGDDDDIGDDGDNDGKGNNDDNSLIGYKGDDRLKGYRGDDRLYGDDDDDDLDGGDDDDFLDGGRGDDKANGGRGNDLFIDGDASGNDSYIGAAGIDTVSFRESLEGVSVSLLRGRSSSVGGNNASTGTGSDKLKSIENVIGSEARDVIIGDSRSNDLEGAGGQDSINGLKGLDRYTGGDDGDTFVFSKASDTRLGRRADVITDFSSSEEDKIDLRAIDAKKGFTKNDAFAFVDAAPAVAGRGSNGVVWYAGGYLFASTDKDKAAEFAIKVNFKAGNEDGGTLRSDDLLL